MTFSEMFLRSLVANASSRAAPIRGLFGPLAFISVPALAVLTLFASGPVNLMGGAFQTDGSGRFVFLLLLFIVLGAMALALSDSNSTAHAARPLLIVPPAALALLSETGSAFSMVILELALLTILPVCSADLATNRGNVQRYVAGVVIGGTALIVAQALQIGYLSAREPFQLRATVALATFGWTLLLAPFPFQFLLAPIWRSSPSSLAIVRALTLGILLGAVGAAPWLFGEASPLGFLVLSSAAAAVLAGVFALKHRDPLGMCFALSTVDVAFVLAGITTGSHLGLAGALMAVTSHVLALLLLAASLAPGECAFRWRCMDEKWPALRTLGIGIGVLALVGAPATAGFAGRWLLYQATWRTSSLAGIMLIIAAALTVLSLVRSGQHLFVRSHDLDSSVTEAASLGRAVVVAFSAVALLGIGLYPTPLLRVIDRLLAHWAIGAVW